MEEGGNITGNVILTTCKVSSVPVGGLEVPLLLTFSIKSERIFKWIKTFVNGLYDYNFTEEEYRFLFQIVLGLEKRDFH